ncbi:hypothetical protein ACN9MZ_16985 [Pseudoduganella sp. S-14]|uniref:hypothetical protein n=1 Tax=Pseudoduganella sp. S-14 TaxID=3404065 RepID=UPI003CEC7FCD
MKPIHVLPILLLLASCGQQAPSASPSNGNTMTCVAGGLKLAGTGEPEVGVGSFGIQGDTIGGFGLGLTVEHGGKVHEVSSSLMSLPMQSGTYHFPSLSEPGMTLASYKVRTRARDLIRDYNGGIFSQQFSPIENDPEAKLKLQVDKMLVSEAPLPGFKRIHAVGRFQFNAAALPGPEPSDACVRDGIVRSIKGANAGKRQLPLFDAALCGAEKMHVQCDFDVVVDLAKVQ